MTYKYFTKSFHVAMCLFSRCQTMSKYGKNKNVANKVQLRVSLVLVPHVDIFCDFLLNKPMET